MPTNLQQLLEQIIVSPDFDQKVQLALSLCTCEVTQALPPSDNPERFRQPGRPKNFTVVPPRQVPSRKNIQDPARRAQFLHSIANIELLAIELPALSLLRFGCDAPERIRLQLKIIKEEAEHFSLLRNRLRDWNVAFGSIPVHHGLWDYAWKCSNEIEHQIMIPCYLEARGLDVCPEFVNKFKKLGDNQTADIIQRIVDDEVGHVRAGMDFLHSLSAESPHLFSDTLNRLLEGRVRSKIPVNEALRKAAGFTVEEIKLLAG